MKSPDKKELQENINTTLINNQVITDIAVAIKKHNGTAYLVGGAVRDIVMNKKSKDFDFEIYNLDLNTLTKISSQFGKRVEKVGKSFGVLKIFFADGLDIDIALPRTESKSSIGHKGFEVHSNQNLNQKTACERRDFTMNALMLNVNNQEILDYFNGISHIRNKILKIVKPETFVEDPLRILRGMQFAGRFEMTYDQEDLKTYKSILPELKTLPAERLQLEWDKLLLKSQKPSFGLDFGIKTGLFAELFPNLQKLEEIPQNPDHHPEGNVFTHTKLVLDKAAETIRHKNLSPSQAKIIMYSALCHDLGKIEKTKLLDDKIVAHGHAKASVELTKEFLEQLKMDKKSTAKILKLVEHHMKIHLFYKEKDQIKNKAIRKLAAELYPATIEELALLTEADHYGRGFKNIETFEAGSWIIEKSNALSVFKNKPENIISGKDLIQLKFKPGKNFNVLINLANQLHDNLEYTKETIMELLNQFESITKAILHFNNKLEK